MVAQMSYSETTRVIDSWELARRKFGSDEDVGTAIMLNLFRLHPDTKTVFGFRANQNIESNPLLRMGILVHAARILHMFDTVISMLGPDTELLEEVLAGVGVKDRQAPR